MINLHKNSTLSDNHQIHAYTYASAAARVAGTGFVAADLNKIAIQTDNNSLWILTAVTPTWVSVGGITRIISSISAATTALAVANADYIYLVSGTTTLTLPTAVGNTNKYTVKNTGVATVTIGTTSAQTIDGSTTAPLPVRYTSLSLISDGSNWNVI